MAPKTVLVTGANGHFGFRVVVSALQAGYKIRAVVCRQEAADQIKAAASIQPYLSNLEIVLVQDLLKEAAFDEAVIGMDFVIHVASPIMQQADDYYNDIEQPARQMMISILRSAAKSSSVKRVVVTSSVVVLDFDKKKPLGATDLAPIPDPYEELKSGFEAYRASKRIARAEGMKLASTDKAGSDLINILPSVILVPNELTTSASSMITAGTNRYIACTLAGVPQSVAPVAGSVHVNDCAEIHDRALDPKIDGNQDFLAHANRIEWGDGMVNKIVEKYFESELKSGVLKLVGEETKMLDVSFDAKRTVEVFGIKWISSEEQIRSVIEQYVEPKKVEKK